MCALSLHWCLRRRDETRRDETRERRGEERRGEERRWWRGEERRGREERLEVWLYLSVLLYVRGLSLLCRSHWTSLTPCLNCPALTSLTMTLTRTELKKEIKKWTWNENVLVVVEMMPQTVKYMHMYYYFMMGFHICKYKAFNWKNGMEKVTFEKWPVTFMWPSYNKKEKNIY